MIRRDRNILILNHSGMYKFIDVRVDKVDKRTRKNTIFYNLSVDEDESYIANGFVVHNCLCVRMPLYVTERPIMRAWERETPYERPYTPDEILNFQNLIRA